MWNFISRAISRFGPKKNLKGLAKDFSDDETSSDTSLDEELECQICCETFNMVENVPYVLLCGHTLCKSCIMGLQRASIKLFSSLRIKIPFLISCPWCNSLTFRLVRSGDPRFPRKNYFLLWMIESRTGYRIKPSSSLICKDNHHRNQVWSPWRTSSVFGNYHMNGANMSSTDRSSSTLTHNNNSRLGSVRTRALLRKALDFFIRMAAKLPLVILFVIVLSAIPVIACMVLLYLLITILVAVPSLLALYFAYRALCWLGRALRA